MLPNMLPNLNDFYFCCSMLPSLIQSQVRNISHDLPSHVLRSCDTSIDKMEGAKDWLLSEVEGFGRAVPACGM